MLALFFLICPLVVSIDRGRPTTGPSRNFTSPDVCLEYRTLFRCAENLEGALLICPDKLSYRCVDRPQIGMKCPSCIPPEKLDRCLIPPTISCTDYIKKKGSPVMYPVMNKLQRTLCSPCYRSIAVNECTEDEGKECAKKIAQGNLPDCRSGERPGIENCCVTCKVPIHTERDPPCLKDKLKPCETAAAAFERDDNGCLTCRPNFPTRTIGDVCSSTDFRKHKELVPECTTTEKPTVNRSEPTCGPSCVRPASKKHLLEVIACKKLLPQCNDDDTSKRDFFLPGRACPLCEPKRPQCPEKCDSQKVCIRSLSGDRKLCVRKRRVVLRMKMKQILESGLRNISKADMAGILKELLQRFCERNDQESRCKPNLERILSSLNCSALRKISSSSGDTTLELDLEVAESESEDDPSSQLLEDAVKDDDTYVDKAESTPPSNIPPEKMCFVPDTIVKCRLLGIKMPLCDNERPKCERKEVTEQKQKGKKFLMVCPSCIPEEFVGHLCKEKVSKLCTKVMNRTEKWDAAKRSICPSCFKVPERDECSTEDKRMCLMKFHKGDIPECVENEVAIRKGCCISCKLGRMPLFRDQCRPGDLPECLSPQGALKFDARQAKEIVGQRDDKGCRKCSPRGPLRKPTTRCSIADFRRYKELVPACSAGERIYLAKNSTRCGPPCVRQASKKHLSQVIACLKNLTTCEVGDQLQNRFIYLPDAACPICEPPKPSCPLNCDDKQVCVRYMEASGHIQRICVPRRKLRLRLKLKQSIVKQAQNLDKRAFTRLLLEFVERFCERNSQMERCSEALDVIRGSLKCTNKNITSDGVSAEIEYGQPDFKTGRRLLADEVDSISSLLLDASSDDDTYVDGVVVSEVSDPDTDPTDPPTVLDPSTATILKSSIYLTSLLALLFFQF